MSFLNVINTYFTPYYMKYLCTWMILFILSQSLLLPIAYICPRSGCCNVYVVNPYDSRWVYRFERQPLNVAVKDIGTKGGFASAIFQHASSPTRRTLFHSAPPRSLTIFQPRILYFCTARLWNLGFG